MADFVDTSVLVEALVEGAAHHAACAAALRDAEMTASHCLVETFSILTGGRLGFRVPAEATAKLIRYHTTRLHLVTLSGPETLGLLAKAKTSGVRGGAIYDFLILEAARQADASRVLTLNLKDFMPLARGLVVMAPS